MQVLVSQISVSHRASGAIINPAVEVLLPNIVSCGIRIRPSNWPAKLNTLPTRISQTTGHVVDALLGVLSVSMHC